MKNEGSNEDCGKTDTSGKQDVRDGRSCIFTDRGMIRVFIYVHTLLILLFLPRASPSHTHKHKITYAKVKWHTYLPSTNVRSLSKSL